MVELKIMKVIKVSRMEKNILPWLKENWFKVSVLAVCLIMVLGYLIHLNKQQARLASREVQAHLLEQEKLAQEHISNRRKECMDIYKVESGKWGNVLEWSYREPYLDSEGGKAGDFCLISYKESTPKSKAQCEKDYAESKKFAKEHNLSSFFGFDDYLKCTSGTFTKEF